MAPFYFATISYVVKNAFIHNNWLHRVATMITFYNDRIEIISFSKLAPNQTIDGFYNGNSIPVNEDLSTVFLATHLSERVGKGVPLIVSRYGRKVFKIDDSGVKVTIPYNWKRQYNNDNNITKKLVNKVVDKLVNKVVDKVTVTDKRILEYILRELLISRLLQNLFCEKANY